MVRRCNRSSVMPFQSQANPPHAKGHTMERHILERIDPALLGERLAEARRARGLTQQEAAGEIDVARTTITAMEKGVRRPRPSELIALARLYGCQVGDFVRATAH